MNPTEHLEVTLLFSPREPYPLEGIRVDGKRETLPSGIHTRTQILTHYAQQGWRVVSGYSDLYTFERARPAAGTRR